MKPSPESNTGLFFPLAWLKLNLSITGSGEGGQRFRAEPGSKQKTGKNCDKLDTM